MAYIYVPRAVQDQPTCPIVVNNKRIEIKFVKVVNDNGKAIVYISDDMVKWYLCEK